MLKALFVLAFVSVGASAGFAQVEKSAVEGVRNFAQVKTTVACAGATTPDALSGIKKMGFASVINLRVATEQGANLETEEAAAKEAKIAYFHIPFDSAKLDPAVIDRFLEVVTKPANVPAFIHCASGNRAAAVWMVKRVLIDKWDTEKASQEAADLGLTSSALKTFALDYIKAHTK